jgi:hypothetical protein
MNTWRQHKLDKRALNQAQFFVFTIYDLRFTIYRPFLVVAQNHHRQ